MNDVIEVKLGDIVAVLDGRRVPVNKKERAERSKGKAESELVPYYGATGKAGVIDDYLFNEEILLIGEDAAPFFDKRKQIAYLINGKSWVNNHAHVLKAFTSVSSNRFLKFYLDNFNFYGFVRGTTRYKLNQQSLREIPVSLPPLNEQHRIVNKIEELFTKLDAGVASLKKAQQLLKQYRQSVLKAAFEGKLTAEWRAEQLADPESPLNKEPASVLLEKIKAERRRKWEEAELAKMTAKGKVPKNDKWKEKYSEAPPVHFVNLPEIPDSWLWSRLDGIAIIKGGVTKGHKKKNDSPIEVPYLRVANVQRGYLNLKEIKTIEVSAQDLEAMRLETRDVLFNEGGDLDKLGRGWIWEGQIEDCIHQNHVFRARLIDSKFSAKWVSNFGNTFGKEHFIKHWKPKINYSSMSRPEHHLRIADTGFISNSL